MAKINTVAYVCDACGKVNVPSGPDGEMPLGLHGNVTEVSAASGTGGEWYACSRRCLHKAIVSVVEGSWRD